MKKTLHCEDPVGNWIKFAEKKPEKMGYYLICKEREYRMAFWCDAYFTDEEPPDYWVEINLPRGPLQRRSGSKLLATLPKEAGAVYNLMQWKDVLVATCEGGVYTIKDGKAEPYSPTSGPVYAHIDSSGVISDDPASPDAA